MRCVLCGGPPLRKGYLQEPYSFVVESISLLAACCISESRITEYDTWLQTQFPELLIMSEWRSKHVEFYHQIKSIKSCILLVFIWSLYTKMHGPMNIKKLNSYLFRHRNVILKEPSITRKYNLMFFWPCIIVYTFSNYQLNAQFFYFSTICMLHYAPQHVSSSVLPETCWGA